MKLNDIIDFFESLVPLDLQESWDNSGLQIGNREEEITGILLALDLDDNVLDYAMENKFNFILTHHPIIFQPVNQLVEEPGSKHMILKAIKNGINVYAAHTNLDNVEGGVNDTLANLVDISDTEVLEPFNGDESNGLGRYGYIETMPARDFLTILKGELHLDNMIVYGDVDRDVYKVAVVGGSGASTIDTCIEKGVDLLITGDIKYHQGEYARENGMILVDIGHYESEVVILDVLKNVFEEGLENQIPVEVYDKDHPSRMIF